MQVFLAGATGAIGRQLVPQLLADGHRVVAMTRSPQHAERLRATGVEPVVADVFDRDAVVTAVTAARPEVVIHELTGLAGVGNLRNFDKQFAVTNRLRTEGTDNLLVAARAAGARRFLAQSYGGWPYERAGGPIKTEDDPLDPRPPRSQVRTMDAIRRLEATVTDAPDIEGLALRYGGFYGPHTSYARDGEIAELVRKRRFPLVGDGSGIWSFAHVADAAAATVAAMVHGSPGVYNITDDLPVTVAEWLPAYAAAIGAKPPRRVPTWLARLAAGEAVVSFMTRVRGMSNAKAKDELAWKPRFPSYREGFREALG